MQQRAVLTRGRVLIAAAEVFARTGFLAASMNDIVEAAGVTKGAVYFHFPSKEALAVAIVEEQFAQWPPMVAAIIEHSPDALTSVVALTYEVGSRFRDDILTTAGVRLSFERELVNAAMPTPFVGWVGILQELFGQARREGQLRSGLVPAATARALVGSFFGIQHVSEMLTNRNDLETRLDEFWRVFLIGVAAEPDWSGTQRAVRRVRAAVRRSPLHMDPDLD
ncbi:MAG TPA: ScbR family autoregulator-binding transcription factor [Jatrophihabitans sp.]|jgi:AcrR family transcriptional regulator|nr:ScbR family autoregulator-binding transcription factor [Jatrophihabitans sp.]